MQHYTTYKRATAALGITRPQAGEEVRARFIIQAHDHYHYEAHPRLLEGWAA
jgi:hypothetical protein